MSIQNLGIFLLLQCISLHAQVVNVVPPDQLVAPLDGSAQFICSSDDVTIESIIWFINGTALGNLPPSEVEVEPIFNPTFRIGLLEFNNLKLEYNMSRIQCHATYETTTVVSSPVTMLLVQVPASAVGNLTVTVSGSIASLSWTAPFSSLENPGITYRVNVSRSNSLADSECDIEETRYSYSLPPDGACHIYDFVVTPVNVAGSGQIASIALTNEVPDEPVLDAGDGHSFNIFMSAGVCSARLTFVDLDTGENIIMGDGELTTAENRITFNTEQLIDNRHYRVAINASSVAGSFTSLAILSTHDILNATATETDDDAIVITTLYSEHSDARGALFDFVFIDDNGDVDFTRSVLLALDRNTSLNHTLPFNLYPGQYRVFVYDIESSGTLYNGVGYPAVMNELTLLSGNEQDPSFEPETASCQITTSPGVISAEFSNTMATAFQMIAQLRDSIEVHILHINQSINLQTPVTVQVEESGVYQVTIILITEEAGIVGSRVEYAEEVMVDIIPTITPTFTPTFTPTITPTTPIPKPIGSIIAGVVLGVILAAVILLVIIVLVCLRKRNKNRNIILNQDIPNEEQRQEIELHTDSKMDDTEDTNSQELTTPIIPSQETEIHANRIQPVNQLRDITTSPDAVPNNIFSYEVEASLVIQVKKAAQVTEEETTISEHQRPFQDTVTHMVFQELPANGSEEEKEKSYFVHRVQELEAKNVDDLVQGMNLHAQEQQKEIRMKVGRALELSEKTSLKETLNDWITNKKKSEVATLRELTCALDQVGLTAVGIELSVDTPSQDIETKDVDILVKKIDSYPWKKIGMALGSSEKELDQTNPEQYLREILIVWLKSSTIPSLKELTLILGFNPTEVLKPQE